MSIIPLPLGRWDVGDWRHRAACRDTTSDLFFPVGITGWAVDQVAAAKEICRQCTVRAACLDYALLTNQDIGVWGGTTEEERRRFRRTWLALRRRVQIPEPIGVIPYQAVDEIGTEVPGRAG